MLFKIMLVGLLAGGLLAAPKTAQAQKSINLTPIGRYEAGAGGTASGNRRLRPGHQTALRDQRGSVPDRCLRYQCPQLPTPASRRSLWEAAYCRTASPSTTASSPSPCKPIRKPALALVKFFDTDGTLLNQVTVGALPDMLVFSHNGRWLLVANEGEPSSYVEPGSLDDDPEGSVSIIDMRRGPALLTQDDVRTATFDDSIPKTNASSIRIYGPGATLAQDLEPEYISRIARLQNCLGNAPGEQRHRDSGYREKLNSLVSSGLGSKIIPCSERLGCQRPGPRGR